MNFRIIECDPRGGFANGKYLENVVDSYEVNKGLSLIKRWPDEASFTMNAERPKENKISDSFYNLDGMIVISEKIMICLSESSLENIEFLPVTIFNHAGKAIEEKFFILHPTSVIDCINIEESDIKWNKIDPEKISACFELVLDDDKLKTCPPIFRPRYLTRKIIIREDFVEKLEGVDIKGIRFVKIEDYEG